MLHQNIEQVARAMTIDGRHVVNIAQSQRIKLRRKTNALVVIYLICNDIDRFFGFAQHFCNTFIQIRNANHYIHHKQNNIGFKNRNFYLLANFSFKNIIRTVYIPACIDYRKRNAVPFTTTINSVARNATHLFYDGTLGFS